MITYTVRTAKWRSVRDSDYSSEVHTGTSLRIAQKVAWELARVLPDRAAVAVFAAENRELPHRLYDAVMDQERGDVVLVPTLHQTHWATIGSGGWQYAEYLPAKS